VPAKSAAVFDLLRLRKWNWTAGRGFELDGFGAGQSAKLADGSFAPGRFAVVGKDSGWALKVISE